MSEEASRLDLARNVAVLYALNEVPGRDQACEISETEGDGNNRLPLLREKELAEDFAFLCATSDSPEEVRAVAIEPQVDGTGILVRVASNTGDLDHVVRGLQAIGYELEVAARRSSCIL